ncbi:hypothetical protein AXG93_2801s1000 [Marchantia polymorpha subsp. ruderalis]|uniref:Uncharacterized protein n=1 Tax=Marchantia polymorpha subsp. ruderalis TaxID=1480154 RepID=A0A176WGS5_MARPO|nr:hypothetical protein AXG93_2801s1000 [Marchantia polymorpha subsp. ruderalis]
MPTMERCLPSEQVPLDTPLAQAPLALEPLEHIPTGEGRDAETLVPSAEAPSAGPDWEDVVGPPGAGSPTPLEVLGGHGVEAAAEEATRPSARESPRISAATEILETEEDTPSEEEEKTAIQLRDEMVINARREIDELRAKV